MAVETDDWLLGLSVGLTVKRGCEEAEAAEEQASHHCSTRHNHHTQSRVAWHNS